MSAGRGPIRSAGTADPGAKAHNVLRLASDVVAGQLIRFGADIWVVDEGIDTTDNTQGGDYNNTTNPLTVAAINYQGYVQGIPGVGQFLKIGNEIMKITAYGGGFITMTRGVLGTTNAVHADAVDIFQSQYRAAEITSAGATLALPCFGGLTPTIASAALAANHLAYGTETGYTATAISANEVLFFASAVGVSSKTCTETLAGSNNLWSNATTVGGRAAGAGTPVNSRVPTATEVALDHMYFYFGFTPSRAIVEVLVTAGGARKLWNGAVTISGGRVTVDNSSTTDWAATDTVTVVAVEP